MLTDQKREIDSNTKIAGEFNTLVSTLDRSSKQKISEETLYSNYRLDQVNLTHIYKTFHSIAAEEKILLKHTWNILQAGHMLCHKTSLNKLKKTEIISSIFSDNNDMKVEIN